MPISAFFPTFTLNREPFGDNEPLYRELKQLTEKLRQWQAHLFESLEFSTAAAWLQFDGSSASPITPDADFNISTVTKTATGDWTVNFETLFATADYASVAAYSGDSSGFELVFEEITKTSSTYRFQLRRRNGGALADAASISLIFFGKQ